MPRPPIVLASSIAFVTLCGCMDRPEVERDAADASLTALPAPGSPPHDGGILELPIGNGEATAFPIAPGSFLTGSFTLPRAATVRGIAVQIGNYGGSADGRLSVELCDADRCASGTARLAGSVDNAGLHISLSPSISVAANAILHYRVIKMEGQTPVAVWLYPPPAEGSGPAIANGTQATEGVPRFSVRF